MLNNRQLKQIKETIDNNIDTLTIDLIIKDLASEFQVSVSQMTRYIEDIYKSNYKNDVMKFEDNADISNSYVESRWKGKRQQSGGGIKCDIINIRY